MRRQPHDRSVSESIAGGATITGPSDPNYKRHRTTAVGKAYIRACPPSEATLLQPLADGLEEDGRAWVLVDKMARLRNNK